jgi:methionyl-tRNA formyltransferase
MKIVFIGGVTFSFKTLQKLLELQAEVVGVCTKHTTLESDLCDLTG